MKISKKWNDKWDEFYDSLSTDDYWLQSEAHFESLCVGWSMANGMTLDNALEFYRAQIERGKF